MQRAISAFTRVFDALWLRRTGTVPSAGVRNGPGSAAHHAAKGGALRRIRGTSPQRKIPPRGGTFLALTQFASDLTVLLALLALTRTVLLLLAGLLAAALLLAGLLTRVLILLTRILILVGHRDLPFQVVGNTTRK
jgi:hypothetical protein